MKQRGFHMFLEQNICVCHLLLRSSFVEKGCKSLGSLITSGFSYMVVGTVGAADALLGEDCCLRSH